MKWKQTDFDASERGGFNGIRGILLCGEDFGKIDENAGKIIKKLGIQKDCLIKCTMFELKSDTDRLFAESSAASLFGDKRAMLISDISALKGDEGILKDLCSNPGLQAFIIINAPDLKRDAGIKKFFEDENEFAALENYMDTERDLPNVIRGVLFENGIIEISNDAMMYMQKNMGSNRAITKSNLEKLSLYLQGKSKVSLEDVENCIGDNGTAATDQLLWGITAGRVEDVATALDRLWSDKVKAGMIVRALSRHFKELMRAKSMGGEPRVFWKYRDQAAVTMKKWNVAKLSQMVAKMSDLERSLRGNGNDESVFSKFCIETAEFASQIKTQRKY